jgi:hypothetical protein
VKADSRSQDFGCYVIHYTPLGERRQFLEKVLSGMNVDWITESEVIVESYPWRNSSRVFGISKRLIAADLGINARSLSRSRKRARYESYIYRFASLLGPRFKDTSFGSLPSIKQLPNKILEVNAMHVHALLLFLQEDYEWGLFLEDDSVFSKEGLEQVAIISKDRRRRATWINLNDGAELKRTTSEKLIDKYGLFRVKPPTTRCASAYMINRKYAERLKDLIMVHGLPNWLPIDVMFQVANRKMNVEAFWSDPAKFIQGSESGIYTSNLKSLRNS